MSALISVHDYWEEQACGEAYAVGADDRDRLAAQAEARYTLEPYIRPFAKFHEGRQKAVLEIGVGMGADHLEWARGSSQTDLHGPDTRSGPTKPGDSEPAVLAGVDLTERAVAFTRARLKMHGLASDLSIGNAERLSFPNDSFDIVYSWGVLHHTPDTPQAFREVARVLRPGGVARIMIYHRASVTAAMLWARYGLARGKPFLSLDQIVSEFLESPGTKAYSVAQAHELCRRAGYSQHTVHIQLNHGDLLLGEVGARHRGAALSLAKAVWPRWLIRTVFRKAGLYLLIEARK